VRGMKSIEALTPLYTAALFPGIYAGLVTLLRDLNSGHWARPTAAGSWWVRDVVAHLLDVDLRLLAGAKLGKLENWDAAWFWMRLFGNALKTTGNRATSLVFLVFPGFQARNTGEGREWGKPTKATGAAFLPDAREEQR
jgi:hypothetical protein